MAKTFTFASFGVNFKLLTYSVFFIATLSSARTATAQNAAITGIGNTTATPVAGVPHDYITGLNEVVNPANGSLTILVKANVPHERGVNWPYYVWSYNSNLTYKLNPTWETDETGSGTAAQLQNIDIEGAYIPPTGQLNTEYITLPSGNGTSQGYGCQVTASFMFSDPNGGLHSLGLGVANPYGGNGAVGNCSPFANAFNEYIGGDAQYKTYITNPNSSPVAFTVVDLHGDVVYSEDSNGNYANTTDRTWSTSTSGNTTTLTVPGSAPYVLTSSSVTASFSVSLTKLTTSTGCNGFTSASLSSSSSEPVTGIELPDTESYQFQYDPNTGLLNRIIYPTHAWVKYTWSIVPSADGASWTGVGGTEGTGCSVVYGWPEITKRVVSFDGSTADEEQDFCYTTTWPGESGTFGNCQSSGSGSPTSYDWTSKTTTVTTKDLLRGTSFQTVYTYSPIQPPADLPAGAPETLGVVPEENTIQYYDTNGSLLKTVTKAWQTMSLLSGECTTLPDGKTSGTFYQYQKYSGFSSYGTPLNGEALWTDLPIDVAQYDYGQVASVCTQPSAAPLRETKTVYHTFPVSPLFQFTSILDRPDSVQDYGNGTLLSETDYTYDQSSPKYYSSYGHDDSHYGLGSTSPRGNPTTIVKKCFVSNCTPSTTTYTYDTNGNVLTVVDGCGYATCPDMVATSHKTSYVYSDNYTSDDGTGPGNTYAYVTQITDPFGNNTQYQWGFNDGRLRSKIDENSQKTTLCYTAGGCGGGTFDPFFRLTAVQNPDKGGETIIYSDAGPTPSVESIILENLSTSMTTTTTYNAYGDPITVIDPAGSMVNTTYDGLEHAWTVTNPYQSLSDPTYGKTTYTYDALGRKTIQLQQDKVSTLQWCYNDVPAQGQTNCSANLGTETSPTNLQNDSWVDYSDETGRHWQQITDGLGRLTAVLEPNASNVPALETDYQYDALGNLLRVDQWGGTNGSGGERLRSFSYDSLSHLLNSTNPETGTISYIYDANGNVESKTAPAPNSASGSTATITTSYAYDAMNRILSKSTIDGYGTPTACYQYGLSAGQNPSENLVGRLENEWTQSSTSNGTPVACAPTFPSSGTLTSKSFTAYDPMGRVSTEVSCVYPNCTTSTPQQYPLTYFYDLAGHITSYSNGNNSIQFTNNYDGAGRLSSITSTWVDTTHPGTLFSLPTYDPAGQLTAATYGSGLTLTRFYDNRLRVTGESDSGGIVQVATPGTATIDVTGSEQTQ
jgi:YD repeat-containing protein